MNYSRKMEMLAKQKAIYEGLKSIGEEVSSLYADAILIKQSDSIVSKSYLIAHIAREIDSGLREILAPKVIQEEKLKDPELKDRGNLVSILVALDLPVDDPFANKYHKIAKQFHKYAHKQGAYGKPRSLNLFSPLWNDYEDILLKLVGSFINQLKRIERIVKYEIPSKQILLTLPNLFKDEKLERHFFSNLKKESWFEPLNENGFFSPKTIKHDFYWNQTDYLEELSTRIKEGKVAKDFGKPLANLVEEILTYSINVEYLNNFRIRYTLLLILTNIPKEFINGNVISLIPHCIKTKHENILESNQIFQFYYSFLGVYYKSKYKSIVEQLTKLIFSITQQEHYKDHSSYDSGNYFSFIRAHRLKEASENPKFINAIATYCSNDTIFYIADNLEKYLATSYDYSIESVFRINDIDSYTYSVKSNFTLILKNVSLQIANTSTKQIIEILATLVSERYKHHHILQISLYIISKTWNKTKCVFFDYISKNDQKKLFSNYLVSDDLYYFLEEIGEKVEENEILQIIEIIEQGSQDENFYNSGKFLDDFKLRWYSALSKNKNIQSKYVKLSKKMGKTKIEIHHKNNEYVTFGSVSPLSIDKIEKMAINELTEYLMTYDPERTFRGASVEGLESNLFDTIKNRPELFTENASSFLKVPYRYIFKIFFGLSEAYEGGYQLSWNEILQFIEEYASQEAFGTDRLVLKNVSYPYDYSSVITSMCRLISKGLRNNETAFSNDDLLIKIKMILFSFTSRFISRELPERDRGKLGSALQVVNSTTGIIVSTVLDYSLHNARVNCQENENPKWSNEEMEIFTTFAVNGIQEFYVRLGWNIRNFFYLDKEWSKKLIKSIPQKDLQTRKSFFGGHIINLSSSTFEYISLKPLYEEAIKDDWKIVDSTMGNSPVETQLLIFYFSGYENLEEESLLAKHLKTKNLKSLKGLIHSLSFKFEKHYLSLSGEKQIIFRNKIIRLWEYVLNILEISAGDDKINIEDIQDFGILLHLSKYIIELDEKTTSLFLRSSPFTSRRLSVEIIIKALNKLKNTGNRERSLEYSSQIFEKLVLKETYYASVLTNEINEFVEDLYKDGREELKSRANHICNEFAKHGQYELRELYEKYN